MSAPAFTVAVAGAGTMGAGIAQVAAQAGHDVLLYDAMPDAAARGRARIENSLQQQVDKGRLAAADKDACLARIACIDSIDGLAPAQLCIEAIVEDLAAKQRLLAAIETAAPGLEILASNTSSLSITAIARGLSRPERLVGIHFFNPAPVMKLVEIVTGAASNAHVVERAKSLVASWGKTPVLARSTPGFIVNRIARPYYAESLRLIEEGVADAATIDALLVEGGGFRMGPCALMDLIGHDVNYAVTNAVFEAFYQDPRYRPSLVQKDLVDAGWLGAKSGRGFYDHGPGAIKPAPQTEPAAASAAGAAPASIAQLAVPGVVFAVSDGRSAAQRAADEARPVILHDWIAPSRSKRVGIAASSDVTPDQWRMAVAGLQSAGLKVSALGDAPGHVVLRTMSMIVNEAYEAQLCRVATAADIDTAMTLGVNYPCGPTEMGRQIGLTRVLAVLDAIHAETGDPRYRPSLGLRRAALATGKAEPGG